MTSVTTSMLRPVHHLESFPIRLRDEIADWIDDPRWTHFLTLNFKEGTGEQNARRAVGRFLKSIRRQFIGRRGSPRLPCIVSFEHGLSGHLHTHILLELPLDSFPLSDIVYVRAVLSGFWENASGCTAWISETCPDGTSWCKEIAEGESYADYITKEIPRNPDAIQSELCETGPLRHK